MSTQQVACYDIVICGGGVAGLWVLNVLIKAGYNVLLVENEALGGLQTIASQGMIHGGQRYLLGSNTSTLAGSISALPQRWDSCLCGNGEIDLSQVQVLSDNQVMWPTGGSLSYFALGTASYLIKAKTRKLNSWEVPEALADLKCPVYELPEKVIDIASLVRVLSAPHETQIITGEVESISRDGCITISGISLETQIVICAAGLGNERFLSQLHVEELSSQRRPLRQLMVKTIDFPLYGHGITTDYRPRITITSHPLPTGGYVWYLGGAIADETLALTNDDAIEYAKREMKILFGHLDWSGKEWSTWHGFRAEPYCENGRLPSGPVVQQYGNALVVWPSKLTLAPILGDQIISLLIDKLIKPKYSGSDLYRQNSSTFPPLAPFPWSKTTWIS